MKCKYKGIYLSKALTCMKIFLYKQELHFCQGDGYLWSRCCMNKYTSHIDHFTPQHTAFEQSAACLSVFFRVTSWFDTVCNAVTRWMNFRKKTSCMNMNYTYPTTIFRSILPKMYKFLVEKDIFSFLLMNFSRSN